MNLSFRCPELLRAAEEKARMEGLSFSDYIKSLVSRDLGCELSATGSSEHSPLRRSPGRENPHENNISTTKKYE